MVESSISIVEVRVLLFSHTTGYQLRSFNDAAVELGVELVFATDRCHQLDDPWQDRAIAVRFHDPSRRSAPSLDYARTRPVDGVIAVGDRPVVTAARAAEALGCPWHTVAGARASSDKRQSRAVLAAAGLPSPRFHVHALSSFDASASVGDGGLSVCAQAGGAVGEPRRDPRELAERSSTSALRRIRALLARPEIRAARAGLEDEILVEAYIDGDEFAIEGVLTDGRLTLFAIFDKPDPLDGSVLRGDDLRHAVAARGERPGADRCRRSLAPPRRSGCGTVRSTRSAASPDGEVYVLEVAARPIGGLCSRVLSFEDRATGRRTASLEDCCSARGRRSRSIAGRAKRPPRP